MESKKILVIDDNASNMKLFRFLLSTSDYEVRSAVDAREALELVVSFRPDLVLLDLQLPDMDGLEITRRLKHDPNTRDTPIIAVTAYAMKGDEEKAREAGVDAYLTKPIDKTTFRQTVANYLAKGVDHHAATEPH